jgi:uncharacterized membrane protein
MVSANAFSRATLLGLATGIRSMTPLATISWAASSGRLDLPEEAPFSLLARRSVSSVLLLAAAGEVVGDKLPFTPPRTKPGPLLGRIAFGAVVGAIGFTAEDEPIPLGAAVGGLAAAWGSFAGLGMRTQLTNSGVPALVAGIIGDALAMTLAVSAVLQRGSTVR